VDYTKKSKEVLSQSAKRGAASGVAT